VRLRDVSTKTTPVLSTDSMQVTSPVTTGSMPADATATAVAATVAVTSASLPAPSTTGLRGRTTRHPRKRGEERGRETRGLQRVDALIASGQLDKAIAHLRRLVTEMPLSMRGYLRMASLLREIQRPGEALSVLRNAIECVPNVAAPREALAEMCLEMGRWEEAIQQSRALLSISPRSLVARDVLSAAYFQSGQLDLALRITDEMIVLDPTDAANHFKRGVLLQQKGRIAGAIQAFSRVVAMAPESEAAEESRAAIEMLDNYQIRQVIARAVEDMPFRLALLRDPAEAVNSRGYVLSERGIMALARVPLSDLPPAPPGWRQFMTQ
jgi:tetratricopeptide (TPR) repeat protein